MAPKKDDKTATTGKLGKACTAIIQNVHKYLTSVDSGESSSGDTFQLTLKRTGRRNPNITQLTAKMTGLNEATVKRHVGLDLASLPSDTKKKAPKRKAAWGWFKKFNDRRAFEREERESFGLFGLSGGSSTSEAIPASSGNEAGAEPIASALTVPESKQESPSSTVIAKDEAKEESDEMTSDDEMSDEEEDDSD